VCLHTACYDVNTSSDKWLSRLDACGWLSHIKDALTCACVAAQCVDKEGAMVLVHGSTGTDTTLIVTSLAQLILDPDCRTVTGYTTTRDAATTTVVNALMHFLCYH